METATKQTVKIKRIILAEENADDAEIFTDASADINKVVNVEVFNTGQKLLEVLHNTTDFPDIVVIDLKMPVKNGFECLEEIKKTKLWKNAKVVILSTLSQLEQIKNTYNLGANLYVAKSTNYVDFKKTLAECLELNLDDLK
jgi:DNA-binding NarL/FixJ family response regulator